MGAAKRVSVRVLLINPNIESLPDPVFPIGPAFLAGSLRENGFDCRVLDLCFAEDYRGAVETAVAEAQPEVVGLSLRNLDNVSYPNYTSYLPFYRQVVATVRGRSRAAVVLGGSGFTLMPDLILEYLGADFGIVGEGEISFVRLLKQIEGDRGSMKRGLIDSRPAPAGDLDRLAPPDRSGFDNSAYLRWGGMGNIQTKRGCPFRCVYCTYPIIEGEKVRLRSPGKVCDEIETMLGLGVSNLFFVDNVFNHPVSHAVEICREIVRRDLQVKWSCYANPGFLPPALAEQMVLAGCTSVEFGSDAAHPEMLTNLGKNFSLEDLRRSSAVCREMGLSFCHSLLLGGPGETMDTVRATISAVQEMSPTAAICMIGIRVFPNTVLHGVAVREGIIPAGKLSLDPVFYLSPHVREKILPFVQSFSEKNRSWIFPGLNINMDANLQRKLRRFGIRGPLWEHMRSGTRYGNGKLNP